MGKWGAERRTALTVHPHDESQMNPHQGHEDGFQGLSPPVLVVYPSRAYTGLYGRVYACLKMCL